MIRASLDKPTRKEFNEHLADNPKSFKEFHQVLESDYTVALTRMAAYIESTGGNCSIIIPPGIYSFNPNYEGTWRSLVEMVDVENVTIWGYGAILHQVKDPLWTANDDSKNQEGPIQFRGTGDGTCNNIKIIGLTVEGDNVPYDVATGDGACMGIAFRGVADSLIKDCKCTGWGTDGIYIGTTYGNAYKSKNITIENVVCDNNARQGISIAGCDNTIIINPDIKNTGGGSFGHAIDFEANSPQVNEGGKVIGGSTYNNERGVINFIRSNNIKVIGMDINEPTSNGSVYCDGNVENISISECNIVSNKATLYFNGSNIKGFNFHHNTCKTLSDPNNNATVRINNDGAATAIDEIKIQHNIFNGTGGIYAIIDGDFYFSDNIINASKQMATNADCFGIDSHGVGKTYFERNEININTDIVFAEKLVYILHGTIEKNIFLSHDAAKMYFRDDRLDTNADLAIGYNVFSVNFYYKGESGTGLNINKPGFAKIPITGGVSAALRLVHGGVTRVTSGANAVEGDITISRVNSTGAVAYGCYTAGSPGTWVLIAHHARTGSSASRPTPGVYDKGMMYIDTTLAVDGKPIWWSGTAWIDSTGTVV